MNKILLLLLSAMFVSNIGSAQSFAINTDGSTANASALLDVKSTTRGLLIPRMSKTERNGIPAPAIGLLVFQNAPDSAGFYYYDGSKWSWVAALNGNADSLAWNRNGNAGTNPATHFIGTTDNQPVSFRQNGKWVGRWNAITGNYFIGTGAGQNMTTSGNIAIGDSSLAKSLFGNGITAIGQYALKENLFGSWNTAVGYRSLMNVTNSNFNTAVGTLALTLNTGEGNTATGHYALGSNTTGATNVANGAFTLFNNTTGFSNVAVGIRALNWNTTKSNLVAIGDSALYYNGSGASAAQAIENTAVGSKSLFTNSIGYGNAAFGFNSMQANVSGNNNAAAGHTALAANTTGSGNAAFGTWALRNNTVASANTAVGSSALYWNSTGIDNTAVGFHSLFENNVGSYNSGLGFESLESNLGGTNNTAAGYRSLYSNTTGINNTVVGASAGYNNITGSSNSFYGERAGYSIKHANASALFGNGVMGLNCDTSNYNSAFGVAAGSNFDKGDKNSIFGYNSALGLTFGNENTIMGYQASVGDTSDLSVAIGSFAGSKGDENVFIGHDAGKNNNTAFMNGSTFVGSWAGFFKRASYSLLLGYSSTVLVDGLSNASAIGAFSRVDTSNAMVLGSTGVNIGIGITKPYQAKLTVAGSGNTLGIFGIGQAGISLQQNGPTIGYNQYRDISAGNATRYMANGYAWVNYMDQGSGNMYWNSMPSGTANAAGGAETMRIAMTNTGSLGLNVVPNGNGQLQFQNTLDNRKIVLWENANTAIDFFGFGINSGTLRYQVPAAGNVHSFVAGNTALLNIFGTGNATLAGTLTQLSDARLKENIVPINSTINDIDKINAYHYYWKDENKDRDQQIGLLAQEVEAVFPQLVKKDAAGFLSVNYSGFVPLLIKGMQEQQQMITDMQKRLVLLEAQNKMLLQLSKKE